MGRGREVVLFLQSRWDAAEQNCSWDFCRKSSATQGGSSFALMRLCVLTGQGREECRAGWDVNALFDSVNRISYRHIYI